MRKVLTREFLVEVSDGDSNLPIGGIRTITLNTSKTDADTTDFDSGGWAEHFVGERSASVTLDGVYIEDPDSGDRDPGQARCEALALLVGPASMGEFTITSPAGAARVFSGSVQVSGPSGGRNEASTWQAVLTVSGQIAPASI
jgi:hypothetical protein